ncbi:MAG: hypothetical protein Q4D96_01540 [Propionibacteriaceae bacterium]|nr:hypothetical protein [Propionibacteriaceae bacterium]
MTYHKVNAPTCFEIFRKAEQDNASAKESHKSISDEIDALGSACTGKSAKLASSLNAVYNRVLTAAMTGAEQQVTGAVAGGRNAVAAIQRADAEMATATEHAEREANRVDEARITDGKRV